MADFVGEGRGFSRRGLLVGGAILVILLVVGWLLHGYVLGRLLERAIPELGRLAGWDVSFAKAGVSLGAPLVFERVSVRPLESSNTATVFEAGVVEVRFGGMAEVFGARGRLFEGVVLKDFRLFWDLRRDARGPERPMKRASEEMRREEAQMKLWWLPRRVVVERGGVRVAGDDWGVAIVGLETLFDESREGYFRAEWVELSGWGKGGVYRNQAAKTAWKDGQGFLASWQMGEGIRWENLSVYLARPGGIGLDASVRMFGGFVRAGLFFGELRGEPGIDAAVWAGGLNFEEISRYFGGEVSISGELSQARVTFRGNPRRPIDAEGRVGFEVERFGWGGRSCEKLECSAGWINRRLTVSSLNLRQEGNLVSLNGDVALSGDWRDSLASPFALNLVADIKNLQSLSKLIGPPFGEMTGRMTARAAVTGRRQKVDGYLWAEASAASYLGHPVDAARLEVEIRAGEARVSKFEAWSGSDSIVGKGAIGLESPHLYSGEVAVRVDDVSAYTGKLPVALPIEGGGLDLTWQGDGSWRSHSGSFVAHFEDLVTAWTRAGLSAELQGTYSPGNIYLGRLRLMDRKLVMDARASLARSGIKVDDVVLRLGLREIGGGKIFLPLNIFPLLGRHGGVDVLWNRPFFVGLETKGNLPVEEIFGLVGQESPVSGVLRARVDMRGTFMEPVVDVSLEGSGLQPFKDAGKVPPATWGFQMKGDGGFLDVKGRFAAGRAAEISLSGRMPYGFRQGVGGRLTLGDGSGEGVARLNVSKLDLGLLRPYFGGGVALGGVLSGNVSWAIGSSSMEFNGGLGLMNGRLKIPGGVPVVENIDLGLDFDGSEARIIRCRGTMGGGEFQLSGGLFLEDLGNPGLKLEAEGRRLLIYRGAEGRASANVSLRVEGTWQGGKVEGNVELVDSRIFRRLEITPRLAGAGGEQVEKKSWPAAWWPRRDARWALWALDLEVGSAGPVLMGEDASEGGPGELWPDLKVVGSLGEPVLRGDIRIKNSSFALPATTMKVEEGLFFFEEGVPWVPRVDFRGRAKVAGYNVVLDFTGRIDRRRLFVMSEPSLAEEEIVDLLNYGKIERADGGMANAGDGVWLLTQMWFAGLLKHVGVKDVGAVIRRLGLPGLGERAIRWGGEIFVLDKVWGNGLVKVREPLRWMRQSRLTYDFDFR